MRRINRCFNQQLHHLCHGAMQLDVLNNLLVNFLPKTLQGHCQVASFNRGCLILSISKPTLATELRYLLPTLRDTLRMEAKLYRLTSIKLQIMADQYPSEVIVKKKVLSNAAETALKTLRSMPLSPSK